MPSIKPAHDEVASYRRSSRDTPKQSSFNGMLVFSLMLMAIMMGVGGYTLFEVREKLDLANTLLAKGQQNIRDLEDRLAATGTDVSKTLQNVQSSLETNYSEIDKLWKIAYRQNRPKLQELEKKLVSISAANQTLNRRVGTIVSNVDAVTTGFAELSDDMLEIQESLVDESSELATEVALFRAKLQDQEDVVENNRRSISSLSNKISQTEEAIEAIDRFRQQVNQRLLNLRNEAVDESVPEGPPDP